MYNIQWGDTSYPKSFQRFDLGVSFQRFVYILRIHILLTFLGHTETYINAIATFLVELCRKGPRSCDWAHHGRLLALYHANEEQLLVHVRSALFKKLSPCEIMHFYCCVYVLHLQLFLFVVVQWSIYMSHS